MRARLKDLRFWFLVFAVSWLTMIVVSIASRPEPGAPAPEELAAEVANALRTHDFHKLEPLLAVGGEDVAKSTVEQFATAEVENALYRDGAVVVEYTRAGSHESFRMPVREQDGRYLVDVVLTPKA